MKPNAIGAYKRSKSLYNHDIDLAATRQRWLNWLYAAVLNLTLCLALFLSPGVLTTSTFLLGAAPALGGTSLAVYLFSRPILAP